MRLNFLEWLDKKDNDSDKESKRHDDECPENHLKKDIKVSKKDLDDLLDRLNQPEKERSKIEDLERSWRPLPTGKGKKKKRSIKT